jgi:hypothetical protein
MFRSAPDVVYVADAPDSVNVVDTLITLRAESVPATVRFAKPAAPFSFTVLLVPLSVIVLVPFVNVPALESQLPLQVHAPLVKLSVVPAPTVTLPKVTVAVVTVRPPVPTSERAAPPVMLIAFVVRVPDPDVARAPVTSSALVNVDTVPETVRLKKPAVPVILTVFDAPLIVTVDVPFVNVPALLSHDPVTVSAGELTIVKVPPLLTRTSPLVAVPVVAPMFRSAPDVVYVADAPESVKVVDTLSAPRGEIVPVTVRFANPAVPFSFTVLLVPLRVIVDVPFVNVPALLSQLPLHVHAPLVKLNVVPAPTMTLRNVTVEVLAVRPPVPTSEIDEPPVMLLPLVVRVPDPDVASVLLTSRAFVKIETVPETVRL